MIAAGVLLVTHMTDVFDGAKRVAIAVVFSYLVSFTLAAAYFWIKGGRLHNPKAQFKPLLTSALPITGMRTSGSLINSAISLLLPARLIAAGFTQGQAMSEIGVAMGMSMPILSIPSTLIGSLALVMVPELAENFFRGDHKLLRDNIEKALRITALIACLLIPPLFALGTDIGLLLFSNEHGGNIIRNCCFMLLPMSLGMITNSILNSLGYEKQTCLYFFIGAAATLACVWFLPRYTGIYSLMIGMSASSLITMSLNLRLIAQKSKEKVRFFKHTFLSIASIPPAILFGCLLRNMLVALLPLLPATILCGTILFSAQALFLSVLGLAQPRWVKILVKR